MKEIGTVKSQRMDIVDWLKAWAIIAVTFDHLKVFPEPYVVWSVNIFVLVTAAMYSVPGYVFTGKKLAQKIAYIAFIFFSALIFFDAVYDLWYEKANRSFLSVVDKPYYDFVTNPYLGSIWYLSLHIQILALAFFYLKSTAAPKLKNVFLAALLITLLTVAVTHLWLDRYHTIIVSSWAIYLAGGFYLLLPYLHRIENWHKTRWLQFSGFLLALVLVYALYPVIPWAFTNQNRAVPILIPLYAALIGFLTSSFFLLEKFQAGRIFTKTMNVIGRYTLAIYLTHQAFAVVWRPLTQSPKLLSVLVIISGIIFGAAADWIFKMLEKGAGSLLKRRPGLIEQTGTFPSARPRKPG